MSKHRKHNRRKKSSSFKGDGRGSLSTFFSTILPFIEKLEEEDKILLVLPTDDDKPTQGIVCSEELTLLINADYLQRMADYTRQCGSLEAYYDFRQRNPKWAAKHNPDQLLLNICRAARLVIGYRYGLQLGNAEYASGLTGTAEPSPDSPEEHRVPEFPSLDSLPLFITMMSDESLPQSIGYELAGEITLEEYKGNINGNNDNNK